MASRLGFAEERGARQELAEQGVASRANWSGNYVYSAVDLCAPANVAALRNLVAGGASFKALGARHSFNGIADSTGKQVSLEQMDEMVLDRRTGTVTVGAGVRYGRLAPFLEREGFALHNLASLPHVTVVGACATATHGSGMGNGVLSTAVTELEMIVADGSVVTLSRASDGERFCAAVVGLGALGVVTRMTLEVQPTFPMTQVVYENLPFRELEHGFNEIFASGYSVSLFTDWQQHRATQVWVKSRLDDGAGGGPMKPEIFGATPARRQVHMLAGHPAENCTEQMSVPGPWYERMPHFRMGYTPSSGSELQAEYFVPREMGYEAILAIEELREQMAPYLLISELRTVAADDLWMSMAYGRDSMAIHFTWRPEWAAVAALLPLLEAKLAPFAARPHWAKLFAMDAERLLSVYPQMAEFRGMVREGDPAGKFRNAFLDDKVLGL